VKSASSSSFKVMPPIFLANSSWLANKFYSSTNDGWVGHPLTVSINPYSGLRPLMMILLIRASPTFSSGASSDISRHIDFTFVKY
jgi:hypothetical protein